MTLSEIIARLTKLTAAIKLDEFIYDFLAASGTPKATICDCHKFFPAYGCRPNRIGKQTIHDIRIDADFDARFVRLICL